MTTATTVPVTPGDRLVSLDVLRGFALAAMVMGNHAGDWEHVYPSLMHAEWHGWRAADLPFAGFLFITGATLPWSRARGGPWAAIVRRALLLFGIGLLLNALPALDFATWRVPGVLQRIALCYLGATGIARACRWRVAPIAACACLLIAAHTAVLLLVPHPGGAAGDLSPEGNISSWMDRTLLGGHLWMGDRDPEGILGTLSATATTLLGVLVGLWLRRRPNPGAAASLLALFGSAAVLSGAALDDALPINKHLWTASFVLLTAGVSAIALATCHVLVDGDAPGPLRGAATPFFALGMNAIAFYVLSEVIARVVYQIPVGDDATVKSAVYDTAFAPFAPPRVASLSFAAAALVAISLIVIAMYRRRLFLKL